MESFQQYTDTKPFDAMVHDGTGCFVHRTASLSRQIWLVSL
jgi:hypothetical protein